MRIEVSASSYFAGLCYDRNSVKVPEGGMVNLRFSKSVIMGPKPQELKIILEWGED